MTLCPLEKRASRLASRANVDTPFMIVSATSVRLNVKVPCSGFLRRAAATSASPVVVPSRRSTSAARSAAVTSRIVSSAASASAWRSRAPASTSETRWSVLRWRCARWRSDSAGSAEVADDSHSISAGSMRLRTTDCIVLSGSATTLAVPPRRNAPGSRYSSTVEPTRIKSPGPADADFTGRSLMKVPLADSRSVTSSASPRRLSVQ